MLSGVSFDKAPCASVDASTDGASAARDSSEANHLDNNLDPEFFELFETLTEAISALAPLT